MQLTKCQPLKVTLWGIPLHILTEDVLLKHIEQANHMQQRIRIYPFYAKHFWGYLFLKRYRHLLQGMHVVYVASKWVLWLIFLRYRGVINGYRKELLATGGSYREGLRLLSFCIDPARLMFNTLESFVILRKTFLFVGIDSLQYKQLRHVLKIFFPDMLFKGAIDKKLLKYRLRDALTLMKKLEPSVIFIGGGLPLRAMGLIEKELLMVEPQNPPYVVAFSAKALRTYSAQRRSSHKAFRSTSEHHLTAKQTTLSLERES